MMRRSPAGRCEVVARSRPTDGEMMRTAYVNGDFVPLDQAKVSILDRGFLFADGVYEVTAVLGGRLIDNEGHLARLDRSLGEIRMACPLPHDRIVAIQEELVRRNGVEEGVVYLQVTRGRGDREFHFPADTEPTLVMFTQSRAIASSPKADTGVSVVTVPDIRWRRRDIKTIALIAQVLAKQHAREAGAEEAWMVEEGCVTEGGSSNAFIINEQNVLITRRTDTSILSGITRKAVMALATDRGLAIEERPFAVEEAYRAAEAFLTSAGTFVLPVVRIDDRVIGNGEPGPLTRQLREYYLAFARAESDGT